MPPSFFLYVATALVAACAAARLLRDVLLRRRLAAVTAPLSVDDRIWLDALSRGVDNDREIIQGFVQQALELREHDLDEAVRRLALAREQVENGALPDVLDTLEVLRRILPTLPSVPRLPSWPETPLRLASSRAVAGVAVFASALALTGRACASVRLWLMARVARRAALSFTAAIATPIGAAFESTRLDHLQRAAHDLQSVQAELSAVAETLLLARASWERVWAARE